VYRLYDIIVNKLCHHYII